MNTDYMDGLCRTEIINGEVLVTPIASMKHSDLTLNIFGHIQQQIDKSICRIYTGNLEYHYDLNNEEDFVIPDIALICDREKSKFGKYYGTPKLIVETINPYSKELDQAIKFSIYEKAGISEYWIADYRNKTIDIFYLDNGQYQKMQSIVFDMKTEIKLRDFPVYLIPTELFYDI